MNLGTGNLEIWAPANGFEVVGGSMGDVGAIVPSAGGTVQNYRIAGTNLQAVGGDATCGSIGDYSTGNVGIIQNGSITGTTCTISGTSSASITHISVSGSGSTGTITITANQSFTLNENVTFSGLSTFTCLNGKDLPVTGTGSSSFTVSTSGLSCSGSGSDTGTALAAAFGGWSMPSFGQTNLTFVGNTVTFPPTTTQGQYVSQYVQYADLEIGCTGCTIKDNVFNTPDAYSQTYACITAYSADMKIDGNLCNGFGAGADGISFAAHTASNLLSFSNNTTILNNTIINPAANSTASLGIGYGCNTPMGSAEYGVIANNLIYGPFFRAIQVQDTASGLNCPVEATIAGNQIYNALTGIYATNATGSVGQTLFSGVTTPTYFSGFTQEIPTFVTPVSFPANTSATGLQLLQSFSFNNQSNTATDLPFTCGSTAATTCRLQFDNYTGTTEWQIGWNETSNLDWEITDASTDRIYLHQGADSEIDAAGTGAVDFNYDGGNTHGGTGGVKFYSGGSSPTLTASITAAGAAKFTGLTDTGLTVAGVVTNTSAGVFGTTPLAGAGAGVVTGPTSGTTAGHLVTEQGTTGQVQDSGTALSSVALTSQLPIAGSLTLTTGTSDSATITGVTSSSHCVFSPSNSTATLSSIQAYVSAVSSNTVTISHAATVGSGATLKIICTVN